eukprot:scaffold25892_cov32-Tisochrysis_lutea.AAC.4
MSLRLSLLSSLAVGRSCGLRWTGASYRQHTRAPAPSLSSALADRPLCVGYVTDVEGDLGFWHSFAELSSVLLKDEEGKLALKDESCHLVFGGDSVDKGACAQRGMS